MAKNDNLTWIDINTDTLSGNLKKAYADYKAKAKAARDAQDAFSALLKPALVKGGHVPANMGSVISFRFGKLSFAVTDEANGGTTKKKGGKPVSL